MHEFNPDWTLAPGALLKEWLEQGGVRVDDLAMKAAVSPETHAAGVVLALDVLTGKPLTGAHAEFLETATEIPARLWLGWEASYRDGLARGRTDVTWQ